MLPEDVTLEDLVTSGRIGWSIIESMPSTSVVAFDRGLQIVAAAGPLLRRIDLEPAAMIGRHVRDVLPAAMYDRYVAHYGLAIAGESSYEQEETPDGLAYHSQFNPIRGVSGEVIGGFVHTSDITQQRATDELRRQFETAFEDAPIGIALVSPDGAFIRSNAALSEIVGYTAGELAAMSFQQITHPDDLGEDVAQVESALRGEIDRYSLDKRYVTAGGQVIWVSLYASLVRGVDGKPLHFIAQIKDITERKRMEETLHRLADHDDLTGIWNRRRFEEELERQVARSRRYGEPAALLLLDLDGFKPINDSFGHRSGDRLLTAIAQTLRGRLRQTDSLARIGGDEFTVLLGNTTAAQARLIADELADAIEATSIDVGGRQVSVGASIGVIAIDRTVESGDTALIDADRAMYRTKRARTGRHGLGGL